MIKNVIQTCALGLLLMACGKDKEGFKTAENGVVYKFLVQKTEGATPKEGDFITIAYTFTTKFKGKDSVVIDSRKSTPTGTVEMLMPKALFKGGMEDGMAMMHIGDSAVFKFPLDSFFLKTNTMDKKLPEGYTAGDPMYFAVKLVSIKPKADFEKEMAEKQKQAQAQAATAEVEEGAKLAAYLKTNNITTPALPSGLIVIEKVKGTGRQVVAKDSVYIHYIGKLIDGTEFQASERDGNGPLGLVLGNTPPDVIVGWEEAISKLKVGSEADIIIPSKLAYGAQARGPIPAFATLLFNIKVIKAKPSK